MIGREGGGREMEEQRRVKNDWERGRGERWRNRGG